MLREKTITHSEFIYVKSLYPDKNYSEIFDTAWKSSEAGIRYNRNKKIIISCSTFLFVFTAIFLLSLYNGQAIHAYAMDIVDFRLLKLDNPELFAKVEEAGKVFQSNCRGLNVEQQETMLNQILSRVLNADELETLSKSIVGMSPKELINTFKSLS